MNSKITKCKDSLSHFINEYTKVRSWKKIYKMGLLKIALYQEIALISVICSSSHSQFGHYFIFTQMYMDVLPGFYKFRIIFFYK